MDSQDVNNESVTPGNPSELLGNENIGQPAEGVVQPTAPANNVYPKPVQPLKQQANIISPPEPSTQYPRDSNPLPAAVQDGVVSGPGQVVPASQQPLPVSANVNQGSQQDFNFKILTPKYLIIIGLVTVVSVVIDAFVSSGVGFVLFLLGLIYAYVTLSKIKKNPNTAYTESEKVKAVAVMAFDPLFAQALYYRRLHDQDPRAAKSYNKIGWQIDGLELALLVVAIATKLLLRI